MIIIINNANNDNIKNHHDNNNNNNNNNSNARPRLLAPAALLEAVAGPTLSGCLSSFVLCVCPLCPDHLWRPCPMLVRFPRWRLSEPMSGKETTGTKPCSKNALSNFVRILTFSRFTLSGLCPRFYLIRFYSNRSAHSAARTLVITSLEARWDLFGLSGRLT